MAVIDYTRRSERLGNLGTPARVMAPPVPDFMAGVDRSGAWERAHARRAHAWDQVADAGARIGKAAIELDAILESRENDRILSKAAGMVMQINDENLTSPERGEDGRPLGLLNRLGEDCRDLPREGHDRLNETLKAVSRELELSDRQVASLQEMLSPYAFSCMGRLRARRTSEIGRVQVEQAKALVDEDVRTIANGNDTDDMYGRAMRDFEAYADVAGIAGTARSNARTKFAEGLFEAGVKRTVGELGSVEDFDAAIKAAEERPDTLFMGSEVLKREMGGKVAGDLHAKIMKEMRDERDRFVGRERHAKTVAAEQLKGAMVKRELELMGKDMPQTEWVRFYRECGNDEGLRAASPETALKYLETAERLDRAIKKGVSDQTEETLSLRMTDLMAKEISGDAELQGGKIAAEQAAIWRDYQTALHAGKLSEGFASTYLNRIRNRLTDEERNAMREFYSAFGWHGELDREGEPSAKDRKDWAKANVLAPVDETVPMTSDVAKGRKLTGSQMFELGDTFLRQLKTMGPEAYRPEVVKTVIGEIKSRRMADDFNRNRDELAFKIMNIQRNLNAGVQNDEGTDAGRNAGNGGSGDRSGREDD